MIGDTLRDLRTLIVSKFKKDHVAPVPDHEPKKAAGRPPVYVSQPDSAPYLPWRQELNEPEYGQCWCFDIAWMVQMAKASG
ncbi:unnamed protein product, partial [Mesorhabditis spiculigera]